MSENTTVVLDFDGTLTADPHFHGAYDMTEVDVALIRELQDAGYCVAISTCGSVRLISDVLERCGVEVYADYKMREWTWHDDRVVLVSNRKISGRVLVDDKALQWTHGDSVNRIYERIGRWATPTC